jgi:flagellar biosynthetic protein FlhB
MRRNGDSLVLNLQLFAGEKTEKATPKRRQEARKQGQVIKSRDLTSALILATGFVALKVFGPFILNKIIMFYRYIFIDCLNKHQIFTIQGMANQAVTHSQ